MTRGWRGPNVNSIASIINVMNSQLVERKVMITQAVTVASEIGAARRPSVE